MDRPEPPRRPVPARLSGRRFPAPAILSDLDAQVDYLVTELGRDYRQVDATLRAPGVTVDRASDVVLLRFEMPAVVVNGRPGDPAVQKVRSYAGGARPGRWPPIGVRVHDHRSPAVRKCIG